MKNIKQENGRSMVEMLGVLAIIGVLSIGGIAGYTMAMNRYRANEILDTASKLSVVAQTTGANGVTTTKKPTLQDIGFAEGVTNVHGATFTDIYSGGDVVLTGTVTQGVQSALNSILGCDVTVGTTAIVGENACKAAAGTKLGSE